MHDVTVSTETCVRGPRAIVPSGLVPDWTASRCQDDDERYAWVLITSWALITGRLLRADVPARLLTKDELIEFWADDQTAEGHGAPAIKVPRDELR